MNPDNNALTSEDKINNNSTDDPDTQPKEEFLHTIISINIIPPPSPIIPTPHIDPLALLCINTQPRLPVQQTLSNNSKNNMNFDEIIENTHNILLEKQIEKKKENELLLQKVINPPQKKVRILPPGKNLSYLLEDKKLEKKK